MKILVEVVCMTTILLLLLSGCSKADSSKQESSNNESIIQTDSSDIKRYFNEDTWKNLNDKLEKLFKKDSVEISLSDKYKSETAQLEALGSGDLYFTVEGIDFKVVIKDRTSEEITFSINDSNHNNSGWHSNNRIYIFGESIEDIKKDGDFADGKDYLGNAKRYKKIDNAVSEKIIKETEKQTKEIPTSAN